MSRKRDKDRDYWIVRSHWQGFSPWQIGKALNTYPGSISYLLIKFNAYMPNDKTASYGLSEFARELNIPNSTLHLRVHSCELPGIKYKSWDRVKAKKLSETQ